MTSKEYLAKAEKLSAKLAMICQTMVAKDDIDDLAEGIGGILRSTDIEAVAKLMLDCSDAAMEDIVMKSSNHDTIKNYAMLAAVLIRAGAPLYGEMRRAEERRKRRRR